MPAVLTGRRTPQDRRGHPSKALRGHLPLGRKGQEKNLGADLSTLAAQSIPSDEREPKRQRHENSKLAPAPARLATTSDDADLHKGPGADEQSHVISSAAVHSKQPFGAVLEDQQMLQQKQQPPGLCGTEVRTSLDVTCSMSFDIKPSYPFLGADFA